jgi:hypothetical protein
MEDRGATGRTDGISVFAIFVFAGAGTASDRVSAVDAGSPRIAHNVFGWVAASFNTPSLSTVSFNARAVPGT